MQSILSRLNRLITILERGGIQVSAIALFCLMAIIVIDVGCRYFLNTPLPWSFDFITLYLAVALFFFSLSDTLRVNGHVAVDVVLKALPIRWRHVASAIGFLLACIPFAGMVWLSLDKTFYTFAKAEVMPGVIEFPIWPSALFTTLGLLTLLARMIFRVVDHSYAAWTSMPTIELPIEGETIGVE